MKWDEQRLYPKTKSFLFHHLSVQSFQDFSVISTCIQDIEPAKYMTSLSLSAALANWKHLGVLLRQITIGLPTFSPSALTKNTAVIICLDFFPPLFFFLFWAEPLVGKVLKKHLLSLIFKISLWSYPLHSSFICSIQDLIAVHGVIQKRWETYLDFHLSSKPSDTLKPSNSGRFKVCLIFIASYLSRGPFK